MATSPAISDYFSTSAKRPHPSSVSSSDSPVFSPKSKRVLLDSVDSVDLCSQEVSEEVTENMSVEETLQAMQRSLQTLATKEDIRVMRETVSSEMEKMFTKMNEKMEEIESRMFDVEVRLDKTEEENKILKGENTELREKLNDMEQYQRRWNLRVFNLEEKKAETAAETTDKVCRMFTEMVGVSTTPEDLEACHRVGAMTSGGGGGRNRAVIVRFKTRKLREEILSNRKKLKGKKLSIGEDLTYENAKLCTSAFKHSATLSSWTNNGKVWCKLKNGKNLRVKYGCDLNEMLNNEMK